MQLERDDIEDVWIKIFEEYITIQKYNLSKIYSRISAKLLRDFIQDIGGKKLFVVITFEGARV